MKQIVTCIALFASVLAFAQEESFKDVFDRAKSHLVKYELEQAAPLLEELKVREPDNANVHYLLGVCLSERPQPGDRSIELLNFGIDRVNKAYNPKSYAEKGIPVYVHYFLTIAYSKEGRCSEAVNARKEFAKAYEIENDFYTQDAARWCSKCVEIEKANELREDTMLSEPQIEETPDPEETPDVENTEVVVNEMVTKRVSYTTPTPLWGVQIGAFSKFAPKNDYNYIKNVNAYIDNAGLVRYVIGCVTFKSQAERILQAAKQNGIKDAFIVDINKTKKFSEEIISFNRSSLKAKASGSIDYRVQLGAFSDMKDKDVESIYFGFQEVSEYQHQGLTMITVGSFDIYDESSLYREQVKSKGFKDAFVVAFRDQNRISVEEAQLVEKQRVFDNVTNRRKKKRH